MITDLQYLEFLRKLVVDQRGKNSLNLSEWESHFLGSFSASARQNLWLTEGRRKIVDRMWCKYGPELNHPHPLDTVTERPKMAPADPDGCEYLVRLDSVQQRCNEPAEFQEPGRLRYCRMHAEAVEKAMKWSGKKIALIKFQPAGSRALAPMARGGLTT